MSEFDSAIKKLAEVEEIRLPEGFDERNNKLLHTLVDKKSAISNQLTFFKKVNFAAIIIVVLIFGTTTVVANELSGGYFFASFFSSRANKDITTDNNYMNSDQLNNISSSTVGTVVDTDELKIDIKGMIYSGNAVNIMLRITAKKLDNVYNDNGLEMLKNYRFESERGSLFEDFSMGSIQYFYKDDNNDLADNQFEILYTVIGNENFMGSKYTIIFDELGYFDRDLRFVAIYDTGWQFPISFDAKANNSKIIYVDKILDIDDYKFTFESVNITPLSCTMKFKSFEMDKNTILVELIYNEVSNMIFALSDNVKFDNNSFKYSTVSEETDYEAVVTFTVPIDINKLDHITIFGQDFSIQDIN